MSMLEEAQALWEEIKPQVTVTEPQEAETEPLELAAVHHQADDEVPEPVAELAPVESDPAALIAPLLEQIRALSSENALLRSLAVAAVTQESDLEELRNIVASWNRPKRSFWRRIFRR
jgi:hypothetical protein